MSTFANIAKNISTIANLSKNNSDMSNIQNSHGLYFILTDLLDYVLVGENETEFLIWDDFTSYSNLIKN